MLTKKIGLFFTVLFITLIQAITPFFGNYQTILAQPSEGSSMSGTGAWVDAVTITYNSKTYIRNNPFGSSTEFEGQGGGCPGTINVTGRATATLTDSVQAANGECSGSTTIVVTNANDRTVNAYQTSEDVIYMPRCPESNGSLTAGRGDYQIRSDCFYVRIGNDQPTQSGNETCAQRGYLGTSANIDEGKCTRYVLCDSVSGSSGRNCSHAGGGSSSSWIEPGGGGMIVRAQKCDRVGCVSQSPGSNSLTFANNRAITTPQSATAALDAQAANDEDNIVGDCEFGKTNHGWKIWETIGSVGENALNWFGCTVIKGVMTFIEFLNNSIDDYLRTDIDNFRDADSGIRQVWSSMLTIANILFVMAFLVMVIATALNLGIVDAYTVKKALPRLVIAAILANLSYSLVLVAIDITNTLGGAVKDIILQPVGGDAALRTAFSGVQETNALGVVGLGTGVAVGFGLSALATGGIFVLIPLLLTLAFGILVAWGVIMVRTIVILLLVVLSPIAIAFWALPGLESLEKRWWKMLVQMLMVYPYIMGFIAAGQFVAILIARSSGASTNTPISVDNPPDVGIGNAIAIIAVIVLPYILLPTVFKLATSTIGNITGMMNSKGKGIFDRGSNAARERAKTTQRAYDKQRSKDIKQGSRQRIGSNKAIDRIASGRGVSGWNARRGLADLDIAGAESANKKEKRDSATAMTNKQYSDTFAHAQANEAALRSSGEMKASEDARKYAMRKVRETAQDSNDVYEIASARSFLANQKAGGELDAMNEHLLLGRGAAGQALMDESLQDEDSYARSKDLSPHMVQSSMYKDSSGVVRRITSTTELEEARGIAAKNASEAAKAKMSAEGWKHYIKHDSASAQTDLTDIHDNENLRGELKKETLDKLRDDYGMTP